MAAEPLLRDYRPAQLLARLIWLDRHRPTAFLLPIEDAEYIRVQIISDPNARIVFLCGDQTAREQLHHLGRGIPFIRKRRREPRRLKLKAWHRVTAGGAGTQVSDLQEILESDWSDPDGWSVP